MIINTPEGILQGAATWVQLILVSKSSYCPSKFQQVKLNYREGSPGKNVKESWVGKTTLVGWASSPTIKDWLVRKLEELGKALIQLRAVLEITQVKVTQVYVGGQPKGLELEIFWTITVNWAREEGDQCIPIQVW